METVTLGFMFLFVTVGLLIVGLSVPLMRRRVKPNYLYGFRTPKTMSSEQVWYEANAYAGRMSLRAGTIFIAAAIAFYFILRPNAYNIACTIVLLSSMAVALFLSFRHLRSL